MHKLGYFVVLQTKTIFGIALHFLRNIKYHQEIWNNLSVEILFKFLTAGHLVHSGPCPAAGHLDTARKILVFRYSNFLSTLFYHPWHSLFFDRDHLRSNMRIICGPGIICGPVQLPLRESWLFERVFFSANSFFTVSSWYYPSLWDFPLIDRIYREKNLSKYKQGTLGIQFASLNIAWAARY